MATTTLDRKRLATCIRNVYPNAQISWHGSERSLTLYVQKNVDEDEYRLTIDTSYVTPTTFSSLVDEVLDLIR